MNNVLAEIIRYGNAFLAIILIIAGTLIGGNAGSWLVGFFCGFIFAILICGLLALFISMRSELILIRKALTEEAP